MAKLTREQLIEAFLDEVAQFFDVGAPLYPDSLFTDPRDGEAITAQGLLERIRLGKDAKEPNRG